MDVNAFTWPDGSTTYQVLDSTPQEDEAMQGAPTAAEWIAANATIVETYVIS